MWAFIGKQLLKKHWGKLLTIVLVGVFCIALIPFSIIQYAFWYQYDCKPQMELYDYDATSDQDGEKCDEEKEVLTYDPVKEKDIIDIGENIKKARDDAMKEVIDPDAISFLADYDIKDKTLHHPGENYRMLNRTQADGFYNTNPNGSGTGTTGTGTGSGTGTTGGGTYTGGTTSTNGPRVYNPANTIETYWQWAQDVSAATGWHPLFIMAQWTQEIGSDFYSNNFAKNNNMAGQTWHSGLPESMKGTARPRGEGGYYIRYDDAVDGYIQFIQNNSRYNKVATFTTPEEQAAEVARQGWATDPNYLNALTSIINRYRNQFGGSAALAPNNGDKIVGIAQRYLQEMGEGQLEPKKRVSYLMGGGRLTQGGAADCSDFSQAVYKEAGIDIGGYTVAQMFDSGGEFVDGIQNLAPGDLVFFHNPKSGGYGYANEYNGKTYRISHVGVYIGNGDMIHLSFDNTIHVSDITSGHYRDIFVAGKRWLAPGTGAYQMDLSGGDVNEAEIHLRALNQSDVFALEALDLDEELLESEEYKDTKVFKTWLVAKLIKKKGEKGEPPYDEIYKRSIEAEEKQDGQTWIDRNMNWLLYVQYEAYKCYMIGDDDETNRGFKGWFMRVFGLGDKPCKTLDSLYKEAGGSGQFIDELVRNQVEQQHAIVEDHWQCAEEPNDLVAGQAREWRKNKYIPPGAIPDCGPELVPIIVRTHTTYNTYQKLIEILYDFEPYAMHELDKTVDKKDMTYPNLIKFIIGGIYEDATGGNYALVPSTDWIVPMEHLTYNFSSPFGTRTLNGTTRSHNGVDLGTRSIARVPVYASASGEVISVGTNNGGYGSLVTIDHKNGYYSMYAHFWLEDIVVREGQQVAQGQLLGGVGNDTTTSQWHLHFEICKDVYDGGGGVKLCKTYVDPQDYVSGLSTDYDQNHATKRANQFTGAKDYSGADEKWNKMKARAGSEVILMPGYTPSGGTEAGGGFLGDWVKEFESGEKGPSAYWDDPVGGNSLGTYQLTERTANGGKGSLYTFGNFIQSKYVDYYNKLSPYDPSSDAFVSRWIALGKADPVGFGGAQQAFIKSQHYDPVYAKVVQAVGVDLSTRSRAIREAIWSSAVQYPAYVPSIFKEALAGRELTSMSDEEFIQRIYAVKIQNIPKNFASSSGDVRASIEKRYKTERDKLLAEMGKCGC